MSRRGYLKKRPYTPGSPPNTHDNNSFNEGSNKNNNENDGTYNTPSRPFTLSSIHHSLATPPPTPTPPPQLHEALIGFLILFFMFYVIYTQPAGTLRTIWYFLWYAGVGLLGHVFFCNLWWDLYREDADWAARDRGVMGSVKEVVVMKEDEWEVVVRGRSGREGVVRE